MKPRLYIPGQIIHLKTVNKSHSLSTSSSCCCTCCYKLSNNSNHNRNNNNCWKFLINWLFCKLFHKTKYVLYYSNINQFNEILVHPRMAWDHFPDRYMEELKTIAKI